MRIVEPGYVNRSLAPQLDRWLIPIIGSIIELVMQTGFRKGNPKKGKRRVHSL